MVDELANAMFVPWDVLMDITEQCVFVLHPFFVLCLPICISPVVFSSHPVQFVIPLFLLLLHSAGFPLPWTICAKRFVISSALSISEDYLGRKCKMELLIVL